MILVTTSGKVGSEAARLLAQRDIPVRLLTRDIDKNQYLADTGVDVVRGDLDVRATVDAAMQGISGVILVSQAVPAQELNVVQSAVEAGAGHVVKITSDSSPDSPIARRRAQAEIEAALISSGLGYTLLKNNAYMQNFLMLAPSIAATASFSSSTGAGRISMIDARDVAAVAARVIATPTPYISKTYWPTGPASLSYADAADVLSGVLGRKIEFNQITFEQQRQAMIGAGLPESVAQDNATAMKLFADGEAAYVTDDVQDITGRPARTFRQFVTDYVSLFS